MTPPPEDRQFRRIRIAYQVKLVADDRIIAYPTAIDLSMGGLLVNGRDHLPIGSRCGVAILLANGEAGRRVVARGIVVRNDERGMAIAFSKALDSKSEDSLRALIRSLDPGAEETIDSLGQTQHPQPLEGVAQDPESSLVSLMDRIKPASNRRTEAVEAWEPPVFEQYDDIRHWLKESVMSATMYERYPDGRWTMQLLLKEQNPGTYRYIVL